MDGQNTIYRRIQDVRLRKITEDVGEVTGTTHDVKCSGNAMTITKEDSAAVAVGDYVITEENAGWANWQTVVALHLPYATFVSEGWRKIR